MGLGVAGVGRGRGLGIGLLVEVLLGSTGLGAGVVVVTIVDAPKALEMVSAVRIDRLGWKPNRGGNEAPLGLGGRGGR